MFSLEGIGDDGPVVDFDKGTVGGKAPDPEIAAMAFGEKPWTEEKLATVNAPRRAVFNPTLFQPLQPTGFTLAQQQSLDPAGYAMQQEQQQQQQSGPEVNKTLIMLVVAAVACGVLYFMFKDRK